MRNPHIWARDNRDKWLAVGGLLVVSLLWGSSFVSIKIAAKSFGAVSIASYRVGIAALCLVILCIAKGEKAPKDKNTIITLVFLSLFGQIIPFISLGVSGHLTSSQNSAMMMGAVPLLTLLIGRFFLPDERWSLGRWLALIIGFSGVLVALGESTPNLSSSDWFFTSDFEGSLFAFLAAAGYAAGAVLSRMASKDISPLVVCAFTMTISALILWSYSIFAGTVQVEADANTWSAIILLGIINTATAYGVYFWLIKFAGATFASTNNYIVPVVGLLMGYVMLSEKITLNEFLGLLLIMLGVYLFSCVKPQLDPQPHRR